MQLLKNVNILKGQWQIICDILLTEKLRNEHHTMNRILMEQLNYIVKYWDCYYIKIFLIVCLSP